MFRIAQRRYLGNKNSILPFIDNIIRDEIDKFNSFCDIFSGTGVVGSYFNKKDIKIISNDLLYHNFVSLNAFLNQEEFNQDKILGIIDKFNNSSPKQENYFSKNFGDRYFSNENAKKIGYIREKFILITSLNYSIDKISHTVGHYDAYIKKEIKESIFKMKMLDIEIEANKNNEIYNKDANLLIRDIECDILYLDPPYNSRQYSDAYHLLENLSLWQKPQLFGVAKKFDRSKIKSEYCKVNAYNQFDDLIYNAKCKYILLSYNNMGNSGNSRSNAKISDDEIMTSLSKRGKVKIFEQDYREFNAGKEKNYISYNRDIRIAS
ncbi:MAG: DNA adenine methylase [Sulfurovum sp.]